MCMPLPRVHAVERLVQQQHLRVVHERRGHPGALPHALGVGLDPAVRRVGHLDQLRAPVAAAVGSGSFCIFALASTNSRPVRKLCTASRSATRPSGR